MSSSSETSLLDNTAPVTGNPASALCCTEAPTEAFAPLPTRQEVFQSLSSPGGLPHRVVMADLVGSGRDFLIPAVAIGHPTAVTSLDACQSPSQRQYGLQYTERVLTEGRDAAGGQCDQGAELALWELQQRSRFQDQRQRERKAAQEPLEREAAQRRVLQAAKLHRELQAAHQQQAREAAQQRAALDQHHNASDEWSILMQNAPQQPPDASSQHSTHFAPQEQQQQQQQHYNISSQQWSNGTQNPLQQQEDTSSDWSHGTQMAPQEQHFAPQNATPFAPLSAAQGSHSSGSYYPSG